MVSYKPKIILLLFLLSIPLSVFAAVIDLGKQGYTEPVDIAGLISQTTAFIRQVESQKDLNSLAKEFTAPSPKIAFHTKLPLATTPRTFTKSFPAKAVYPDTTMVFFTADQRSEEFLRGKQFNYGYCISYNNISEVSKFTKRLGITYPLALISDDKALTDLGIKSWPAVLSVRNGVITITEGGQ